MKLINRWYRLQTYELVMTYDPLSSGVELTAILWYLEFMETFNMSVSPFLYLMYELLLVSLQSCSILLYCLTYFYDMSKLTVDILPVEWSACMLCNTLARSRRATVG